MNRPDLWRIPFARIAANATILLLYAFSYLRDGEAAGRQRWLFALDLPAEVPAGEVTMLRR